MCARTYTKFSKEGDRNAGMRRDTIEDVKIQITCFYSTRIWKEVAVIMQPKKEMIHVFDQGRLKFTIFKEHKM